MAGKGSRMEIDLSTILEEPSEGEIQKEMREFFAFHIKRGRLLARVQDSGSQWPKDLKPGRFRISQKLVDEFPMVFRGKQFMGLPLVVDPELHGARMIIDAAEESPSESTEGADEPQPQ